MKFRTLTRDIFLRLFLLDPGDPLERGQGVLLLFEGGLRIPDGHLLFLEGSALLLGLLLLERRPNTLQLGSLLLGLLSLLLRRGRLDVALTGGSRQLFL